MTNRLPLWVRSGGQHHVQLAPDELEKAIGADTLDALAQRTCAGHPIVRAAPRAIAATQCMCPA